MAPEQQQNYTMTRMGAVSPTQGFSRIYVGGPRDTIRGCRAAVTVFIPARHLGPVAELSGGARVSRIKRPEFQASSILMVVQWCSQGAGSPGEQLA